MINKLFLTLVLFSATTLAATASACDKPTNKELTAFFSGINEWTEVEGSQSYVLASNKPVFLFIDFRRPEKSKAQWGSKGKDGKSITVCKTKKANQLIVGSGMGRMVVTRHSRSLISSRHLLTGQLFYRPASEVVMDAQNASYQEDDASYEHEAIL